MTVQALAGLSYAGKQMLKTFLLIRLHPPFPSNLRAIQIGTRIKRKERMKADFSGQIGNNIGTRDWYSR